MITIYMNLYFVNVFFVLPSKWLAHVFVCVDLPLTLLSPWLAFSPFPGPKE